jgi:hypothetical protein
MGASVLCLRVRRKSWRISQDSRPSSGYTNQWPCEFKIFYREFYVLGRKPLQWWAISGYRHFEKDKQRNCVDCPRHASINHVGPPCFLWLHSSTWRQAFHRNFVGSLANEAPRSTPPVLSRTKLPRGITDLTRQLSFQCTALSKGITRASGHICKCCFSVRTKAAVLSHDITPRIFLTRHNFQKMKRIWTNRTKMLPVFSIHVKLHLLL